MNSPHIQFADAQTDRELMRFVEKFGPVVVCSSRTEDREFPISVDVPGLEKVEIPGTRTILVARQNLDELRTERRAYRAALSLVAELKQGKKADLSRVREYVSVIADSVSNWPEQWERERKIRTGGQGFLVQPAWVFRQEDLKQVEWNKYHVFLERSDNPMRRALTIDPIAAAHDIICQLVNAYFLRVYLWGDAPVEAPDTDLAGGIRPILYYILRREYLRETRSVGICRNTDCRQLFEVERSGQEYCGDHCSRLQRQREYWERNGKRLRAKRHKRQESSRQDR